MSSAEPAGGTARHRRTLAARSLLADTVRALRRHDLALTAAGVTFYAGIALVPSLLLALKAASLLVGRRRLGSLACTLGDSLPDTLGAADAARHLVEAGIALGPVTVLAAVLPATLYGEGLRRAFVSVTDRPDSLTGWRGRLGLVPLLLAAPLLVLAVLLVTPTLAHLFAGRSIWGKVLGVYIALNVDWLVLWVVLAYVFRAIGPHAPGKRSLLWGSGFTAAFMSGFLQGFVLFLSLPVALGTPFGGSTALGAVVAVGFWLWLLHVLTLVGYVLTWRLDERGGSPFVQLSGDAGRRLTP